MESPEKHRARNLKTYHKNRKEWLALNGPCRKCGSWEDLQVDHIDEKLKVSHRIWTNSKENREKELAKCQVLCEDCHKAKTRGYTAVTAHGTSAQYRRGCKCDLCKKWNTDRVARGRELRGGR